MSHDWQSYSTRPKRKSNPKQDLPRVIEHDYKKGDKVSYIKTQTRHKVTVEIGRYPAEVVSNPQSNTLYIRYYIESENAWYWRKVHYSQVERLANG